MAQMTKMQQKIYDYIAQTLAQQGYPPSVREIGDAVGLKSPSTVHFHLKHMEEMGVINKSGRKGRAITLAQPAADTAIAPRLRRRRRRWSRLPDESPLWERWRRERRSWRRSALKIT